MLGLVKEETLLRVKGRGFLRTEKKRDVLLGWKVLLSRDTVKGGGNALGEDSVK